MCSGEIFAKKCRQQQIFDSDLKGAWHYNHVTFTPVAKDFMLYCRLIYMLSILCVRLTIKVKAGIPESFKVGWYPPKKTGSSHLKLKNLYEKKLQWNFYDLLLRGHLLNGQLSKLSKSVIKVLRHLSLRYRKFKLTPPLRGRNHLLVVTMSDFLHPKVSKSSRSWGMHR